MQDAANVLGNFFKIAVAVIIFGFSVVLEYAFFQSISPVDKPWFPYLAMGLTAGGFVGWMFSFRLIKHHPLHSIIAFLMMIGCALTSLIVAGTEFYSWIAEHYDIATNPAMYQNVTTMLLVVFCAHVVALIIDVSCGHFAKNPFRGGGGNYAPQGYPQYPYYPNALPQYAEGRGEPVHPLASNRSQQAQPKTEPQSAPRNLDNSSEIEAEIPRQPSQPRKQLPPMTDQEDSLSEIFRGGMSSLTGGLKSLISHGRKSES